LLRSRRTFTSTTLVSLSKFISQTVSAIRVRDIDHTYYTQIDVVRTIEQILGLSPMNQRDLVAAPMITAFTDTPDLTPFVALPNEIPLDEMNPAQTTSRLRQAWTEESAKLFTAKPLRPDSGDDNLTRRAIWYASFDFKRPFPGDRRVLFPSQVPLRTKEGDDQVCANLGAFSEKLGGAALFRVDCRQPVS
jgi:hypothetical protein